MTDRAKAAITPDPLGSIGLHEAETGCTYAAGQVRPFQWFCTKCGYAWRDAPSVSEHGAETVLQHDFYRCPVTGDWVYRWADERLVLTDPSGLIDPPIQPHPPAKNGRKEAP